ncbi:hypothetical protein BGZ54_005343, partial [Gamsiella multidivaricata]
LSNPVMSAQDEFTQHQQLLQQQQANLLGALQNHAQDPNTTPDAFVNHLRELLSVIDARTNSIASHLQQANHLTTLSEAVNVIQVQNQDAMQQQTNTIAALQNLVQAILDRTPAPTAAAASLQTAARRPHIPHPFTPAFNGDAKVLSFRAFKAKLSGVFQRFGPAFESDDQCVTFAMGCMAGPPLEHFAPLYNQDIEDEEGLLNDYDAFMTAIEAAYGDRLSIQEAEEKIRFLKQRGTMQEYISEFSTLQSQVRWNQSALVSQFKFGLSEGVRTLLQGQWHSLTTMSTVTEAATTA